MTDPSHISASVYNPELDRAGLLARWLSLRVKVSHDPGAILGMDEFMHQRRIAQEILGAIAGDLFARGGHVKKPALRIDPVVPIAHGFHENAPQILRFFQIRSPSNRHIGEGKGWRDSGERGLFREVLALFLFDSGQRESRQSCPRCPPWVPYAGVW